MIENLFPVIRNAARALIVREQQILLLRKDGYPRGERYALPGGAQDTGETLEKALQRECQEEIGALVQVGELVHVADYFKERDTDPPSTKHLVEFLFHCRVPDDYMPKNGHHPDKHQVEVIWVDIEQLGQLPLFPRSIAPFLMNLSDSDRAVYLGLIE